MPKHSAARWRPISRQALSRTPGREATDGHRGSTSKPKPTCRNRTAAVCPLWRGAASSSQPRLGHLARSRHDAWRHTGSYDCDDLTTQSLFARLTDSSKCLIVLGVRLAPDFADSSGRLLHRSHSLRPADDCSEGSNKLSHNCQAPGTEISMQAQALAQQTRSWHLLHWARLLRLLRGLCDRASCKHCCH